MSYLAKNNQPTGSHAGALDSILISRQDASTVCSSAEVMSNACRKPAFHCCSPFDMERFLGQNVLGTASMR